MLSVCINVACFSLTPLARQLVAISRSGIITISKKINSITTNHTTDNAVFEPPCNFGLGLLPGGSRPKLLQAFKDVTATAPKEAVFQCNIDLGQPTAKVRCFRDGRELADSSKYSTVVRGDEVRLVVRDSELADEAKYRCEASNKLGSVDTEARLTMKSTLRTL